MSKNDGIHPASSKFDLKLRCTIIHDFYSRGWCIFLGVLPNPVEDLLLTNFIEGDMLSSFSGIVQPMRKAAWTRDRGQSDALISALMVTGIL
jgi:hypothetical protein